MSPFDIAFATCEKEFNSELQRFESPLQFAKYLFKERKEQLLTLQQIKAKANSLINKPEIPTITRDEFRAKLRRFDSTFRYSDCRNSYEHGAKQEAEIWEILKAVPAWCADYQEIVCGKIVEID